MNETTRFDNSPEPESTRTLIDQAEQNDAPTQQTAAAD
jgi:hypothetical protein